MKSFFTALAIFFWVATVQAGDQFDPLPLATGAAWAYDAKVKFALNGKDREKTLTWTTEINTVVVRNKIVIARGKGLPSDLAMYDNSVKPAPFLFVKINPWRLYVIHDQGRIDEVWNKATKPDEGLFGIVTEADLLLDFPLLEGKAYGETEQITRSDASYVYVVEGKKQLAASAIKGLPASRSSDEFSISFRTRPDLTTWKFTPGVGFTGYHYSHHGTTGEADCHLTEYRPGN